MTFSILQTWNLSSLSALKQNSICRLHIYIWVKGSMNRRLSTVLGQNNWQNQNLQWLSFTTICILLKSFSLQEEMKLLFHFIIKLSVTLILFRIDWNSYFSGRESKGSTLCRNRDITLPFVRIRVCLAVLLESQSYLRDESLNPIGGERHPTEQYWMLSDDAQ